MQVAVLGGIVDLSSTVLYANKAMYDQNESLTFQVHAMRLSQVLLTLITEVSIAG